ncbi:TPA: hypothetical protein ACKQHR_001562 [Pseudomonas aeruginosa]
MRFSFSTPRSISALKSSAEKLRKSSPTPLTQTEALNEAARRSGFANYTHAKHTLPEKMRALTLSSRWREGTSKGEEQLKYPVPWTAAEIVSMRLKAGRIAGFAAMDEELYCTTVASSSDMARYWLVQALRELMVMEATGLRPDFVVNHLPNKRHEFRGAVDYASISPPGADHLSAWYDPATKSALIMDEPYLARGEPHKRAEDRAKWCKLYGFREIPSNWGGTYFPPKSRLFLLTKIGGSIDLAEIESKLAALPDDFGSSEGDWKGKALSDIPDLESQMQRSLDALIESKFLDEESGVSDGIVTIKRGPGNS